MGYTIRMKGVVMERTKDESRFQIVVMNNKGM